MSIKNPYRNHGPNLINSATAMFLINPTDGVDLQQVCKALRIWNPEATPQTVRFRTVDGSDVTVTVPANALWTEPAVVDQVFNTGTGDTLIIHGYSD